MADSDSDTDIYGSSDSQSDFEGFTEADIRQTRERQAGAGRHTAASSDESDSDEVGY